MRTTQTRSYTIHEIRAATERLCVNMFRRRAEFAVACGPWPVGCGKFWARTDHISRPQAESTWAPASLHVSLVLSSTADICARSPATHTFQTMLPQGVSTEEIR
jgi:hypothetical protein